MMPGSLLRHAPLLLHISMARSNPPWGDQSSATAGSFGAYLGLRKAHGLTPRARVVAMAAAGVAPRIMGIGPAPATEKLMALTDNAVGDIDVIELNEAFASQGLAVMRQLGLDDDAEHVNPNGGAIALGHPLGMSGARLALTATEELHVKGADKAVCTMCIGVGQGIAALIERV